MHSPSFGDNSEIHFTKQTLAQRCSTWSLALQKIDMTRNDSGDNWYKIILLLRWTTIINTRESSSHTKSLAHCTVVAIFYNPISELWYILGLKLPVKYLSVTANN